MPHLDDEGGDRAGVGGAGVGDLDVLEAGVVDHLAPLVPVDVGRGTRAVTNQKSVLRSCDQSEFSIRPHLSTTSHWSCTGLPSRM